MRIIWLSLLLLNYGQMNDGDCLSSIRDSSSLLIFFLNCEYTPSPQWSMRTILFVSPQLQANEWWRLFLVVFTWRGHLHEKPWNDHSCWDMFTWLSNRKIKSFYRDKTCMDLVLQNVHVLLITSNSSTRKPH